MKSPSSEVRRARPLLGTFVEVTVGGLREEYAHRAVDAAFRAVEEVQRRMSFHDPASTLSRLNRLAALEPMRVDAWTFAVLETAARVHRVSGGIFDVSVAPHLQRLGFLPVENPSTVRMERPARFADVELLPGRRVVFHHPDLRLDLGGIAKGFAVDQAIAALRRCGAVSGLVNAGGDLRAFGGAQRIAVRHPENPLAAHYTLRLGEGALATSAHYFAGRWQAGQSLAPIIDPRTGLQASQVRSATVRARSAILADALTKVVMLSAEKALPTLKHFRADAFFCAAQGEAKCSPRWHETLQFSS